MGDRFYEQQKAIKPRKRLKQEIIDSVNILLNKNLSSLKNMTVKDLLELETHLKGN